MPATITVSDAHQKAKRSATDSVPLGGNPNRFNESTLVGRVMNGSYEHTFVVTVTHVINTGDPSPPFASQLLDPTKEYTVTFTEEA